MVLYSLLRSLGYQFSPTSNHQPSVGKLLQTGTKVLSRDRWPIHHDSPDLNPPQLRLTSRKLLWCVISPTDIKSQWRESWKSAPVVNAHLDDSTIRQPGFTIPRQQWSLLNRFRTGQWHCFLKERSTFEQVAALTSYIENGFQQNLKTGAVFLDLTAAYDTVWHTGLMFKLSKSMPYWFTRLVNLLLRDRRFRVHMGNDTSYVMASLKVLFSPRCCSTCTLMTYQLFKAVSSYRALVVRRPSKSMDLID